MHNNIIDIHVGINDNIELSSVLIYLAIFEVLPFVSWLLHPAWRSSVSFLFCREPP